jgi:rhamnose utilization protein RhaD (predicted bifunctional aldolase and dehydrogenase)
VLVAHARILLAGAPHAYDSPQRHADGAKQVAPDAAPPSRAYIRVRVDNGEEVFAAHKHGEQHNVAVPKAAARLAETGVVIDDVVVVVVAAEVVRHGRDR